MSHQFFVDSEQDQTPINSVIYISCDKEDSMERSSMGFVQEIHSSSDEETEEIAPMAPDVPRGRWRNQ